jgi:hypothetical protein
MKSFLTVLAVLSLPALALATTIHVPTDKPTIQEGINTAQNGDTVLVAAGTYLENLCINSKNVLLLSVEGRDSTFIEAALADSPVVSFVGLVDTTCVFEGFSVRNCTSDWGILCDSTSPIIQDCEICYCGRGIFCHSSGARVIGCTIHDNQGFGIQIWGDTPLRQEVVGNLIFANAYGGISCLMAGQGCLVHRNVIRDHTSTDGDPGLAGIDVLTESGKAEVINNTILFNNTGIQIIDRKSDFRDPPLVSTIVNNIVVLNSRNGIGRPYLADKGYVVIDYNDVWGNGSSNNGSGENGISADPLFLDPGNLDFRLQYASLCIDAGDPDAVYNDPDGSRNDMGAFPVQQVPPHATEVNLGPAANGDTVHVRIPSIYWSYFGAAPQEQYHIQVGTDSLWDVAEMWDTGPVTSSDTSSVYAGSPLSNHSSYWLRIRVNDGFEWGLWVQIPMVIHITRLKVPEMYATIQSGINAAASGDTVLVAPGTYSECRVTIGGKNIVLKSESGPRVTILRGECTSHLVLRDGVGRSCIVDGFTIADGYQEWPEPYLTSGIDIFYGASPTIRNCIVVNCLGAGGAIVAEASASPLIENCTLFKNPGSTNISVDSSSSIELTRCVIESCAPNLTWPPQSPNAVFNCCCLHGWSTGPYSYLFAVNGNIDANPRFCDVTTRDFRLATNSQCLPENNECGVLIGALGAGCPNIYLCCDFNHNSEIDVSDVMFFITYIFSNGPTPPSGSNADCSAGSPSIDIDDVVYMIEFMFAGGPEPRAACQ